MASGYELLKGGDDNEVKSPKPYRTIRRVAIGLVTCLALVTLSFLHVHPLSGDPGAQDQYDGDSVRTCASPTPPTARPPAPINPWASLTIEQTVQIQKWLEEPGRALNLTRGAISKTSDNHIFMIEAYYPPKASVLSYFSSLSSSDIPEKYARVTIHHGSAPEPVVKDYLVGPLPIGPSTRMEHLTEVYHLDAIPHNARGFDTRDWTSPEIFEKMAAPLMEAYKVIYAILFLYMLLTRRLVFRNFWAERPRILLRRPAVGRSALTVHSDVCGLVGGATRPASSYTHLTYISTLISAVPIPLNGIS